MNDKKKPRVDGIVFEPLEAEKPISFKFDHKTGKIDIGNANLNSIRIEKSYERDSGKEKVLSSIFSNSTSVEFGVNATILNHYSFLMSVDTNTKTFGDNRYSISTIYNVPGYLSDYGSEIPFVHLASYLFLNPSENINPERIGWFFALKHVIYQYLGPDRKMAIVVDSDKDSLSLINSGSQPLLEKERLPENISLVYASDKDADSLPGKMIKMCHNVSNEIARKLENTKYKVPEFTSGSRYCSGYMRIAEKCITK